MEEVVRLLEVMAADWNAHVPDAAVAVITANSALENFIFNPSSSKYIRTLDCNLYALQNCRVIAIANQM